MMKPSESAIQTAFFQWVDLMVNIDDRFALIAAVPNGGHRHIVTAMRLRREGVRPGIPDVLNFYKSKNHTGLAIEFKAGRNKESYAQIEWMERLKSQGWLCVISRSFEDAQVVTQAHFDERIIK